jgi:hypothetical protein
MTISQQTIQRYAIVSDYLGNQTEENWQQLVKRVLSSVYMDVVYLAAHELVDDLIDTGEDTNQETGDEFSTNRSLREALERVEQEAPWLRS